MNLFTKLINFFSRSDGKKSGSRSSSPVVIIKREREDNNSPKRKTMPREKYKLNPEISIDSSPLCSFYDIRILTSRQ
ncbi:MAG: hypothetical protein IPI12_09275 [Ignavibacteriales bacterium]|nr:hypothetical protein [Ignavibacteriales bacterium]